MKEKVGNSEALKLYDTLEDAAMEVEELKDELSTIVMSVTTAGRERWNTPEVKLGSGKKGRMRKDRYSALVIANMIARNDSKRATGTKISTCRTSRWTTSTRSRRKYVQGARMGSKHFSR